MNVNSPSVLMAQIQNIHPVLLQTNTVYCCNSHMIFKKCMRIRIRVWRSCMCLLWGKRYRVWLRHCATSRKVAGTIPDAVIRIFNWHNSSVRAVVLGSTHLLVEIRTRNISWGVKAALPLSCADCFEVWEPHLTWTLTACQDLYRDCCTFTFMWAFC